MYNYEQLKQTVDLLMEYGIQEKLYVIEVEYSYDSADVTKTEFNNKQDLEKYLEEKYKEDPSELIADIATECLFIFNGTEIKPRIAEKEIIKKIEI